MPRSRSYVPALGFDRLTPLYDPVVRVTTREATFKNRLLDQAALAPGHRVLDLGCGTGTLALAAKRRAPGAEVRGLDGDATVLRRARAKAGAEGFAVAFDEGVADRLPYPDDAFDRVLCTLFFHHLDGPTKERAVREIVRVLEPDGELHLADWGRPGGLLGPALFLPIRLLDGLEPTRDNATGRLPAVLEGGGLVDIRGHGRIQTVLGAMTLLSARSPAETG